MFTQRPANAHKHTLRKAYKRDSAQSTEDAKKFSNYSKGVRYILMRVCTTCPYTEAYELTHQKPGEEKHVSNRS